MCLSLEVDPPQVEPSDETAASAGTLIIACDRTWPSGAQIPDPQNL